MGVILESHIEKMLELAHAVKKIGIEKIAESAGTTARKVNRFVTDPTTSKNSDILKIKRAVEELSNEGKS
jgi:hypothetical protein